jgi:ribonuclease BN (tRNA processing enzyme)
MSHPGPTLGYRLEEAGKCLVYMSDNEVDVASPDLLRGMIELAGDADVLIHDCQFTEGEYASRHDWGHSTPRQAVRVAREAGVRQLIIFHHDPSHSDEQVEALADEARRMAGEVEIVIGREGLSMPVGIRRIAPAVAVDAPISGDAVG